MTPKGDTGTGTRARGNGRALPRTPVTLADVAREAGVSVATASFVLSGRAGSRSSGSPETKAKVRAAAEALRYVPNRTAQAMRTGRGGGVVLALGTLADPWGVSLARQVRSDALPHELSTLILADERWYEYLQGASADSAFITSVDFGADGPEKVRRLAETTSSGIVAFTTQMEPENFDVISSSPLEAVRSAYRKLRSRHDRVHLMMPYAFDPASDVRVPRRAQVFLDAAAEHGDGPPEQLVRPTLPGRRETYRASMEWLGGEDPPSAVVCFTGYQAVALQTAAQNLGVPVPDGLEIISIGDIPEEAQFYGPISYYGVTDVFERISEVVVGRALDRSEHPGRRHVFEWEFFAGDSTRADT